MSSVDYRRASSSRSCGWPGRGSGAWQSRQPGDGARPPTRPPLSRLCGRCSISGLSVMTAEARGSHDSGEPDPKKVWTKAACRRPSVEGVSFDHRVIEPVRSLSADRARAGRHRPLLDGLSIVSMRRTPPLSVIEPSSRGAVANARPRSSRPQASTPAMSGIAVLSGHER
jgi:hypothetical protein